MTMCKSEVLVDIATGQMEECSIKAGIDVGSGRVLVGWDSTAGSACGRKINWKARIRAAIEAHSVPSTKVRRNTDCSPRVMKVRGRWGVAKKWELK